MFNQQLVKAKEKLATAFPIISAITKRRTQISALPTEVTCPPRGEVITAALYFMRLDNLLDIQKNFIKIANNWITSHPDHNLNLSLFEEYQSSYNVAYQWLNQDHSPIMTRQQIAFCKLAIDSIYFGAKKLLQGYDNTNSDFESIIRKYCYKLSLEDVPPFDASNPTPKPKNIFDKPDCKTQGFQPYYLAKKWSPKSTSVPEETNTDDIPLPTQKP